MAAACSHQAASLCPMLDLNTLIVATVVCTLGFAVSMLVLARLIPEEAALRCWSRAAILLLTGIGLTAIRGQWPDIFAWWLANTLVMTGGAYTWLGARAMRGQQADERWVWWYGLACAALNLGLHIWLRTDYARMTALSLSTALVLAGAGRELWLIGNERLTHICRFSSLVFWLGSTLFIGRVLWAHGSPLHVHGLDYRGWHYLVPYAFAILFINWCVFLVTVLVGDKMRGRLLSALNQAEESDRAKSTFLSSVTHEWRTPLNAISGFAQLITTDDHMPAQARQSAALIQTAGNHLLDVVNDLIDLRSIQEGTLEYKFQVCHVQLLIDQVLADLRPQAIQRKVKLHLASVASNPTIWVDPDRFKQILSNLVSNAIKFNVPEGKAWIRWTDDGQYVNVTVIDTGVGIPEHRHRRVFTPFDRLGAESSDVAGTGVGLALCQQLVARMGGSMGFDSHPGKGSTFWVRFPLAMMVRGELVLQNGGNTQEPDQSDYSSTTPNLQMEPPIPHGKRVLYVEDNITNQKLVKAVFDKQLDIEVTLVTTAEEGIEVAKLQRPHLILMDLNLPGMDGYQALKALRADVRTRHIPVMAVTAQTRKDDIAKGKEAGFDAYLTKPLKLGNLISQAMLLLKR